MSALNWFVFLFCRASRRTNQCGKISRHESHNQLLMRKRLPSLGLEARKILDWSGGASTTGAAAMTQGLTATAPLLSSAVSTRSSFLLVSALAVWLFFASIPFFTSGECFRTARLGAPKDSHCATLPAMQTVRRIWKKLVENCSKASRCPSFKNNNILNLNFDEVEVILSPK